MAYRNDGHKGSSLKIGAIVAAAVIGKIAWPAVAPYFSEKARMAELSSDAGTDDALMSDPVAGSTLRVIKERFSADYARLAADVRKAAQADDTAAVQAVFGATIATIVRRDGTRLYQAPHASLASIRTAQGTVMAALNTRPAACAAFLSGKPIEATLRPETETAIVDVARMRLLAIADGRDHPANRPPPPIGTDTVAAFRDAVAATGVAGAAREVLTGKRTQAQATDEAQCEAENAFLTATGAMTEAQGDRIYAAAITL